MALPAIISVLGIPVAAAVGNRILDAIRGGTATQTGARGLTTQQLLVAQQQASLGTAFEVGSRIGIDSQGLPPGTKFEIDSKTGEIVIIKRRRRRKRLLTCGDKSDIAFLTGTLGKGQMGQTAVSALLSRCG